MKQLMLGILVTLALATIASAQTKDVINTPAEIKEAAPASPSIDLKKLDPDDLETLEATAAALEKLRPKIEATQKQASEAMAAYNAAQVVLGNFNTAATAQAMAFYHICARLKLDPDAYRLTKDGKGIEPKPAEKPDDKR